MLPDSVLYVSLEPCNHQGKTPPCTDLILRHGIRHVVIGSIDPNPAMGGKSVDLLRAAGVQVDIAPDPVPFVALNRHFWTNQLEKRPFVLLKWAESRDGFLAALNKDGKPLRTAISGPESAQHVHWLRHMHQAILIGATTAMVDDPGLNTRLWPGYNPLPILLDADCIVPTNSKLFAKDRCVLIVNRHVEKQDGPITWIRHDGPLHALMARLYTTFKVGSLLVEGGGDVLRQFLEAGMVDEVRQVMGPATLGKGVPAPKIPGYFIESGLEMLGADILRCYHPPK